MDSGPDVRPTSGAITNCRRQGTDGLSCMNYIFDSFAEQAQPPLISTPFQRGARAGQGTANRFNGLPGLRKAVETVPGLRRSSATPLKRGVNENGAHPAIPHCFRLRPACWSILLSLLALAGCARFHPEPISPAQTAAVFNTRYLTNENLCAFLETNHVAAPGPGDPWELKDLTLAAFYYQPALAEARAQLLSVQAATLTAGQRPNPSVSVTPAYDTQIPGNPSPWLVPLTFDVPIETAGKRGKRIAQAERHSDVARWSLVGTVWEVRSQIRAALANLYYTSQTASLLARQETAQSNVVRLLEGQLTAGTVSEFEVTQARIALNTTMLARQDAIGKANQARVELARALGVPTRALDGQELSFDALNQFPRELTRPQVRQQALLNRADVRGALAEYAASQAALQLEIANQYPDIHLGPGYAWNSGNAADNEWALGLTVTLPVLNHNQGPVAEAEAKRAQAAAHFMTVQANAVAQIESALAGYEAALNQAATARTLLDNLRKRLNSVRAQVEAGEMDALAVASAQVEFGTGEQNQLDALFKAQQALGQLEDAVQSPLTLPPAALEAAEQPHSRTFEMKLKPIAIGIAVVLCAGAGVFFLVRSHRAASAAAGAEEETPPVVSVQVGSLKRSTLRHYVEGYGTIETAPATAEQPAAGAPLAPATAGVIARVGVVVGQQVKKGDMLDGVELGHSDAWITPNRKWCGSKSSMNSTTRR